MAETPFAPPFFFGAILAGRVPWPEEARAASLNHPSPLNPPRKWLLAAAPGSASHIRLAYNLFYLPAEEGVAVLRLAARAGRQVLAADFKPPERNLELPACLMARAVLQCWPGFWPGTRAGAALTNFLERGGLEGLVRGAGLRVLARRTLLCGAAALLRLENAQGCGFRAFQL